MIIGITGGIGAGKSTVGLIFKKNGIKILEADEIVRELFDQKEISQTTSKILGKNVIDQKGKILKNIIADLVFEDAKELKKLENILHSKVIAKIKKHILEARKKKRMFAIIVPLLFEKRLEGLFDITIAVVSPKKQRIQRASERLKIEPRKVLHRMQYQMKAQKQQRLANFVIRNNGSIKKLKAQTIKLIKENFNL